jgi:hypothetical protein
LVLDAVNGIPGSEETPVIFITGYLELFLTGKAPKPAFLAAGKDPLQEGRRSNAHGL